MRADAQLKMADTEGASVKETKAVSEEEVGEIQQSGDFFIKPEARAASLDTSQ